jgi:hypothetical protein
MARRQLGSRFLPSSNPGLVLISAKRTWADHRYKKSGRPNPLTRSRKVIGLIRVEVKGLRVRLDGEAFRSPAIESTLEEFYP